DAYLHEIAKHFDCTAAAVCYALKQMGMTRKKDHHLQRTRPGQSTHYLTQLAEFSDYQRVYLDETGFDRYLFRPMPAARKGK
ncbi:transposase domain protein, partial [Neisseria sicca VK64]